MPDVNESFACLDIAHVDDGAFPFLHLPQEVLLEIIEIAHEAYVAKNYRRETHPLTNLRL